MARSLIRLVLFFLLLSFFLPFHQPGTAAASTGMQAMPPHPRLYEKIARGEVVLPENDDYVSLLPRWLDRSAAPLYGVHGPIRALAVAVDFSDNVKTVTASYFDSLIFAAPVAGRGSVRDFYADVTYGQVDIITLNLPSALGWQRAPQTYAYYTNGSYCNSNTYPNNCQKLAEDVVDAIDAVVDFSQYDNDGNGIMEPIMLIHAGPGAEFTGSVNDMWSHSWVLHNARNLDGVTISKYVIMPEYWLTVSAASSDMTIGVFAHEMGHGFWGLPDVYDYGTDGSKSAGVGYWSLMASGSWNGPNSGGWGTDGSSPAWPDPWNRVRMGVVTPTDIATNISGYSIPQAYNNPAPAHTVLKLDSAVLGSQEYFLVENRQQTADTYDEYIPGDGLLIWHVDEAMLGLPRPNDYECTSDPHCNCSDSQHYLLALEQADGARDLEFYRPPPVGGGNKGDGGDPFPGSTSNQNWNMSTHPESSSWYACTDTCIGVNNISASGATMTADLQVSCGAPPSAWIFLPVVHKAPVVGPTVTPTVPTATPTTGPGCETLVSEDFEGAFPGVWTVFDNDGATNGEYYWVDSACRPYAGSYSGWGVGGGADGAALSCGDNYPNNADSWMLYGPFSLVGTSDADMTFKLWLYTEGSGNDYVGRYASTDGSNFYGYYTSGNSSGWIDRELDLTSVPTLGDLRGQPNVWVALVFGSNDSTRYAEGGYVDNVVLRRCTGKSAPAATTPGPLPAGLHEQPASAVRPQQNR